MPLPLAIGAMGARGLAMGRSAAQGAKWFRSTTFGKGMGEGIAESFGWDFHKGVNKGFMGLKGNVGYGSRLSAMGRMARRGGMRSVGKMGLGIAGKALMPAFTAFSMYQGFKEEGIWGAGKAGAQAALEWGMMKGAIAVVGGTVAAAATVVAAAGIAGYAFQDRARAYGKSMRKLEMGNPIEDPFGTVATARQRSLMALQNTHLNGRMALGNEGMLMHSSHYRR